MKVFSSVLFWIVLALLAALAAQFLLQDPGVVIVRHGGYDYTTSLATAIAVLLGGLIVLVLLWKLLSWPVRAFHLRRERQQRLRMADGLLAMDRGDYARAEKLLAQVAEQDPANAAVARLAAARAARRRGDLAAAGNHLSALHEGDAPLRAIAHAELALGEHRPTDALVALDAPSAQPLPPRGLWLRAQALAASGRAADAYGMLGSLRQQQAASASRLDAAQTQWAIGALHEAGDANVLANRWDGLGKPVRAHPDVAMAYAERAAALGWNEAASRPVEQVLDSQWDESLAMRYASLPGSRTAKQQETFQRWLVTYPRSPALALAMGRAARERGQWAEAEGHLHRALDNGAGPAAWEELGHGYSQAGDHVQAELCYANALRAARGQRTYPLRAEPPGNRRLTGAMIDAPEPPAGV